MIEKHLDRRHAMDYENCFEALVDAEGIALANPGPPTRLHSMDAGSFISGKLRASAGERKSRARGEVWTDSRLMFNGNGNL